MEIIRFLIVVVSIVSPQKIYQKIFRSFQNRRRADQSHQTLLLTRNVVFSFHILIRQNAFCMPNVALHPVCTFLSESRRVDTTHWLSFLNNGGLI